MATGMGSTMGMCSRQTHFGKHKPRHIIQVDEYLEMIVKTFSESNPLRKAERGILKPAKNNVRDLMSDLKSCSRERDLKEGRRVHTIAVRTGNDSNMFVAAALVNMYAKCGSMVDAQGVFDRMEKLDVVCWTALILGYAENGEGQAALNVFSRMKAAQGCAPNFVTYLAAIKACTSLAADERGKGDCLRQGRLMHYEIGHHMNQAVQNTLINMYAKCGSMVDAQRMFDSIEEPNVVSWSALILGYAENGKGQVALQIFSKMKSTRGCAPNSVTYLAAVKACTSLASEEAGKEKCLKQCREMHLEIGHHMTHVLQNALISMYTKCGSMVDAQRVFDSIEEPNVVSWTALILGYADNGEGEVALNCFCRMKTGCGCGPNSLTYLAAIKACGSLGALAIGRQFHSEITDFDANVMTCLVDFYAKCGSIVEAREVFDSHPMERNVATWNALLAGYGRFGDSVCVFNLFEVMQDQGFKPDAITFVCVLLSCSHAGLVEKAAKYLEAMPMQYGVTPTVIHYTCMVDVLGRVNQVDDAVALIQNMPCNPDAVAWTAVLGACRKWKNVELGRLALQSLGDLDEKNNS